MGLSRVGRPAEDRLFVKGRADDKAFAAESPFNRAKDLAIDRGSAKKFDFSEFLRYRLRSGERQSAVRVLESFDDGDKRPFRRPGGPADDRVQFSFRYVKSTNIISALRRPISRKDVDLEADAPQRRHIRKS
jgi:hypothetical protein